jgi:demethylmenaquinone methyltransferase/2-methoxy-6-polyprenyl-1,4-benzoquinol methylase
MSLETTQPGSKLSRREATLRDYYAARVPEYDRVYEKPERQQELRLLERWVPTVFAGRRVLEVAAGTGYWTRFIAPQTVSLLASDATEQALAVAKKRVISRKVGFALADAYALPGELGRFEAAFAGFWISHVPRSRLGEFFSSLHARLEPGAKVLLLDNRFVAGSNHPISDVDAEGNTYQMRRLQNGSVHKVLKNFPSGDELLGMVAGLGVMGTVLHQWQYFWALAYEMPGA